VIFIFFIIVIIIFCVFLKFLLHLVITTTTAKANGTGGKKIIQKALFEACRSLIEVWKMVCKEVFWQHNCYSRGFVDFFFFP